MRSPTSGGQYHWVSEFAPKSYQRFLSWFVGKIDAHSSIEPRLMGAKGWASVIGWQIGLASLVFIVVCTYSLSLYLQCLSMIEI